MGKEVIKLAQERNHTIVDVFDIDNINELTIENLQKADVVFEFTKPDAAYRNVSLCLDADVPCVCGTTGWTENLKSIKKRCKKEKKAFFYAPNFSIGVNILFQINKKLAKLMNRYSNYEVSVTETHHIHKLDAPSGTALQIANQIVKNIDRKKLARLNEANHDEVLIKALREGEVPGIHSVIYESDVDFLEIKHSSKNRKGLARKRHRRFIKRPG